MKGKGGGNRTLKTIIFIALIAVIVLLVIISLIEKLVKKILKNRAKKIDDYMSELLEAGIVTNSNSFRRCVGTRESKDLYYKTRIPIFLLVVLTGGLYYYASQQGGWDFFMDIVNDLRITIVWPSFTFDSNGFYTSWIKITHFPQFINSLEAIMVYFYLVLSIIILVYTIGKILVFQAALKRGREKSVTVFRKSLDNVVFDSNKATKHEL